MKKLQNLNKVLRDRNRLYVFVIGLLLVSVGAWLVHAHQPNTSDDVAIQTIFSQHIRISGEGAAWLGEDNYILKVPFYLGLDALFENSRSRLLLTSIVFNLIGFGLFFYSSYYFYRRFRGNDAKIHLMLLWLASISCFYLMLIMITPNQRNMEVGLYFLILTLLARYVDGVWSFKGRLRKALIILLAGLFSLLLYSDMFFVFMLVGPVLLLLVGYMYFYKFDRRMWNIGLFLAASVALSFAWKLVFRKLGVHTRDAETSIILFDYLGQDITRAVRGHFYLFGAYFWGEKALGPDAIRKYLNALVMIGTLVAPLVLLRKKARGVRKAIDPWLLFWLLQPLYITSVYIVSNNTSANGDGSFRFLLLIPFFAPVTVSLLIKSIKNQKVTPLAVAGIWLAVFLNIGMMARLTIQEIHDPAPDPNRLQYETIRVAQQYELTKGFGQYWDSTINTYLSNERVTVLPVNCTDIQHFLMSDKALYVPVRKSFYIYNPAQAQGCSETDITDQLGQPEKIVPVQGNVRLYIYDYDITEKLERGYYYE